MEDFWRMYKEFCDIPAVAGREMPMARALEKELGGSFPECCVDHFGNFIASKPGRPRRNRR